MSLSFTFGDAFKEREQEIRQLFDGIPIEELERRRACLIQVKRRFLGSLSMGAYQFVTMCLEHLEELIVLEATKGVTLTSEEIQAIEQAVVNADPEAVMAVARLCLGDETVAELTGTEF